MLYKLLNWLSIWMHKLYIIIINNIWNKLHFYIGYLYNYTV